MPGPDVTSAAVAAGSKIGRAFNVVSLVPSVFLVVLMWALVACGAVTGTPDPEKLGHAAAHLSLASVAALLLIAFLVGYALHPVQFALTQLLEGYWGAGVVARALMVRGVLHYRRKHAQLYKAKRDALKRLKGLSDAERASTRRAGQVVPDLVLAQQATKALGDYPEDPERVMPTKLGNVLRRHEDLTGQAYGLPGVDLIPSLAVVSPAERISHLGEATEQLDVTVSVCTVSAIATLLVAACTVTDGWWLLLTLLPFALCLVAYRGAVSVAHSYGLAMRRLVDLERFTLYESLHLPLPRAASQEAIVAKVVASQLKGAPTEARFTHPQDSAKA